MKKVFVNQDECISCGLCVENVPDVFRFAHNGKAEVFELTGATEEKIQQLAIDICPVCCINWQKE